MLILVLLLTVAALLSSCCSFCKPKVIAKIEYRYPDFSECINDSKKIKVTYPALPKTSMKYFSAADILVLLNNMALREKETEALLAVQYCFLKNLQEFVDTFKEKEDE